MRGSPQTIRKLVEDSRLPAASLSGAMPSSCGRVARSQSGRCRKAVRSESLSRIVVGLNEGKLSDRSGAAAGCWPDA